MKWTIDRSKWRCGGDSRKSHGHGDTQLLNKEGFMCCLGFVAMQSGFIKDDIEFVSKPSDFPSGMRARYPLTIPQCSVSIMRNDDESYNDDGEREQELANMFTSWGHEIKFVGEYA